MTVTDGSTTLYINMTKDNNSQHGNSLKSSASGYIPADNSTIKVKRKIINPTPYVIIYLGLWVLGSSMQYLLGGSWGLLMVICIIGAFIITHLMHERYKK